MPRINQSNPDYRRNGPGLYFYVCGTFTAFFSQGSVPQAGAYRRQLTTCGIPHFAVFRGLAGEIRVISGLFTDGEGVHKWEDEV